MSKVVHALVAHEGKYIVMPPHKAGQEGWGNMNRPNVQEAGGDTTQLYPVNCKFVDFDRTFIYGYVTTCTTTVKSNTGLFNDNDDALVTWGGVAGAVGDTVCPILTSSMDAYTEAAVNLFAGGYLMPRQANPYGTYRIVSSTVYAGGADSVLETDMVIEEDGLQAVVTASSAYCHLSRNPFTALVRHWSEGSDREYKSVMGVSLIDPTASTYQWVQTWGPIHMLGDENAGKTVNTRNQWFANDGTLLAGSGIDFGGTATQHQYAGYLIDATYVASVGVYGSLLFLQLER